VDRIARLEDGLLLARTAAPNKPEMTAMRTRHHLENGAGFAMLAGAENDSLVAPFHALSISPVGWRNQGVGFWCLTGRHLTSTYKSRPQRCAAGGLARSVDPLERALEADDAADAILKLVVEILEVIDFGRDRVTGDE